MALRIVSPSPLFFPSTTPQKPLLHLPCSPHLRLSGSGSRSSGRLSAATLGRELPSPPRGNEIDAGEAEGEEALLVKELEELPEQWRRSKVAWLCKQIPGQKPGILTRLLNAQRKWISQQDATYLVVHCIRIRDNDAAFKVYRWIMAQPRFHFDFALASKLADCLGKDKKFLKCREIFDEIINRGRVPSESTFQILASAYLSAASSVQGCLDEACSVYNKMIEIGDYNPPLRLHNSLLRALAIHPGSSSKRHLDQAELIFSNLANRHNLQIQNEVYAGMIRIHSNQDLPDMARIKALRIGIPEEVDLLLDVSRASSKAGDVEEAVRVWEKLLEAGSVPLQAFLYRMELHARVGEPLRSLEIFKSIPDHGIAATSSAYDKIIEILAGAGEIYLAEEILMELLAGGLKPAPSSFASVMNSCLGLDLHGKVEILFALCKSKIQPSRGVYNVYLNSLARSGNLDKAEEIFGEMQSDSEIGINASSCNAILGLFLASADFSKAEAISRLMSQKKFEIDPPLAVQLDEILASKKKKKKKAADRRTVRPKLDPEQREILIGLLLGGLRLECDESGRRNSVLFDFNLDDPVHDLLRKNIHRRFHQWLESSTGEEEEDEDDLPWRFSTIAHRSFDFFADKFRPEGKPAIPILIGRWLSDRALAYWLMYGGLRSSAGDILLRLKGGELEEDAGRIALALQAKSIGCRVKKKGRTLWIGLRGEDAARFRELTSSYLLPGADEHFGP